MSKKGKDATAQRFGGEFGPYRKPGTTGVSLSTFKTLVWTSNIGGLLLVALSLELLFVQQSFGWGFAALVAGVAIALFPSNYEIVGMNDDEEPMDEGPVQKPETVSKRHSGADTANVTLAPIQRKVRMFTYP